MTLSYCSLIGGEPGPLTGLHMHYLYHAHTYTYYRLMGLDHTNLHSNNFRSSHSRSSRRRRSLYPSFAWRVIVRRLSDSVHPYIVTTIRYGDDMQLIHYDMIGNIQCLIKRPHYLHFSGSANRAHSNEIASRHDDKRPRRLAGAA